MEPPLTLSFSAQGTLVQIPGFLSVWNLIGRDWLSAADISYIHDANNTGKLVYSSLETLGIRMFSRRTISEVFRRAGFWQTFKLHFRILQHLSQNSMDFLKREKQLMGVFSQLFFLSMCPSLGSHVVHIVLQAAINTWWFWTKSSTRARADAATNGTCTG